MRSDVCDRDSYGTELPLHSYIPLLEIRHSEMRVEAGRALKRGDLACRRNKRIREAQQRHTVGNGIEKRFASTEWTAFHGPGDGAIDRISEQTIARPNHGFSIRS